MRSVTLLYRILLPPIFLFRFCSPRPPETSAGPRARYENGRFLERDSGSQNILRDNYSALFISRNETADTFKMNAGEFDNVKKNNWLFKGKMRSYKKRQPSLKAFDNVTTSRLNFVSREGESNVYTSKEAFRLSTYADPFNGVKIIQHRNFDGRKFNKSGHPFDSRAKDILLTETKQFGNISSNRQLGDSIQSSKVGRARPSSKRHHSKVSPKFRERGGIDATLPVGLEPSSSRGAPPEYMVHLFQLLTGTHYETLRNFVVTAFVNINEDTDTQGKISGAHKLAFNVFLPHEKEATHNAELRLYLFFTRPRSAAHNANEITNNSQGQKYIINIFEIQEPGLERHQIAGQTVADPDKIWLSFNVTSAVKNWSTSGMRFLEVSLKICESCPNTDIKYNDGNENSAKNSSDVLVLNLDNENNKGPILVIFSKKHETSTHVTHNREKRDATKRKGGTKKHEDKNLQIKIIDTDYKNPGNLSNSNYFQGLVEFISTMNNDFSNYVETNEVTSLRNAVLLANTVYEQSNKTRKESEQLIKKVKNRTFLGAVNNFRSTTNSSSLHQPFQRRNNGAMKAAMNILRPHNGKYRTLKQERQSHTQSITGENVKQGDVNRTTLRRATKTRFKRSSESVMKDEDGKSGARQKRSKKKRNSCQRNEMYVDFETIKWDKVIIFPRGYQAFECAGKCYTPINEYLTPTKHAIIQTLVHTSYPEQASRACCVPTKLDPISILYWDDNGDIKYDYTYEGMVVAECGCR